MTIVESVAVTQQDDSAAEASAQNGSHLVVAFQADGRTWLVPTREVERVLIAEGIVPIPKFMGLAPFVVGAVHADGQTLTVVDAGIAMSGVPVQNTMKRRLVCIGSGDGAGLALLVDRVVGRIREGEVQPGWAKFDFAVISKHLNRKDPQ